MNLNLKPTAQRFTITANTAKTTTAAATAAPAGSANLGVAKKLLNSRAELRYMPVVMNNSNMVSGASTASGLPIISSQQTQQQQHQLQHQQQQQQHQLQHQQQQQQRHYPTMATITGTIPATVATAGGSLLHILPVTSSQLSSGAALVPQMALIAHNGPSLTTTTTLTNNSNSVTLAQPESLSSGSHMTMATPINVMLSTASTPNTGAMLVTTSGAGTVMPHMASSNTGVSTSILIRNQPAYSSPLLQRNPTVVPVLNEELVKKIVVGSGVPQKAAVAIAPSNSTTLLKAPQPLAAKRLLPTQPTVNKHALNNNKTPQVLAKSKEIPRTSTQNTSSNTLLTPKAHTNANMQPTQITYSNVNSTPQNVTRKSIEKTPVVTLKNSKDTMDNNNAPSESMLKPIVKPAEKQESLLKRVIVGSTSPRSKRSKSLNCALKPEQKPTELLMASERRHSSASAEQCVEISLPPKVSQAVPATAAVPTAIINLVDDNDSDDDMPENNNETENVNKPENEQITEVTETESLEQNTEDDATSVTSVPSESASNSASIITEPEATSTDIATESVEPIPQIKIEDDIVEEEATGSSQSLLKDIKSEITDLLTDQTTSPPPSPSLEKSLYCDEKISISSSSASSTSCLSLQEDNALLPKSSNSSSGQNVLPAVPTNPLGNLYSCVFKMLSAFNMLTWDKQVGTARGTNMSFKLNEFNLLEVHEWCSPRALIHTAYEKPIYERESVPKMNEQNDALLYLCRRCNCHGPPEDFLAPQFCSLKCLKRDMRKRQRDTVPDQVSTVAKQVRKDVSTIAPTPAANGVKKFRWSTYLPQKFDAIAAPVDLFLNPFPTGPNSFQIGMKLEAIDPENCSLFCVCTVVDIQGYRLKLTFDGYEYMYDFWVNADSMDIFPPGWCAKTNRVLQPPKGKTSAEFSWPAYLAECKAIPARKQLFTHLNASSLPSHNPFRVGMHLEAEDLNDTGKLCVASVADVLNDRIRIHFDGWDDCYDYWVDISSPYIHPCGWHVGRQQLIVPPEFENATFNWPDYIKQHGSGIAAVDELFAPREPLDFKPNMKLEVVDPRNPSLIRPATVIGRKGHRVKLHLDCWPNDYCFWLEDDSPDLHPIGWCEATTHDLEPPPGFKMRPAKLICPTAGCRGIGNAKRLYLNTHATRECCPYAPDNWRQKSEKPPRLEHDEIVRAGNVKPVLAPQQLLNDKQILEHIQLLDNIKTRHMQQQEKRHSATTDDASDYNGTYEQLLVIKQEIDAESASEQPESEDRTPEPCLKIAKEFLCDYGPRLQQNYNLWQRNAPFDVNKVKRNPLLWGKRETSQFVRHILQSDEVAFNFARQDIDGIALLMLQQNDLTDMLELKLGPAVKLYSSILQLRTLTALKFIAPGASSNA